jgi:hypothetical protein
MKTKQLRFFLLIVVLIQFSTGCRKGVHSTSVSDSNQISNFISDKGQTYFELKDSQGLHKVYSKELSGSSLLLILDERNIPEVRVLISSKGKAVVTEYRAKQGVSPAGLQLLDGSYMSRVNSGNPAFAQWKGKFSLFKVSNDRRTKTLKLDKSRMGPVVVNIGNNTIVVAREIDCTLDVTSASGFSCSQSSVCTCAFDALCAAARCAQHNDAACFQENLDKVNGCLGLGEYQQGDGGGEGSLRDVLVGEINGSYNLGY